MEVRAEECCNSVRQVVRAHEFAIYYGGAA